MSSLTIRNIDEDLKRNLRVRAARQGRSMEDEVRAILRTALLPDAPTGSELLERIRQRFAPLGDVELTLPERDAMRPPPELPV